MQAGFARFLSANVDILQRSFIEAHPVRKHIELSDAVSSSHFRLSMDVSGIAGSDSARGNEVFHFICSTDAAFREPRVLGVFHIQ